jgi:hypothetical protein
VSDDVDFVNVGGDWMHGKPDFELYHTRLLAGPFKHSTLEVLDAAARFIRPNLLMAQETVSLGKQTHMAAPAWYFLPRRSLPNLTAVPRFQTVGRGFVQARCYPLIASLCLGSVAPAFTRSCR